jgi:hypothetical protein
MLFILPLDGGEWLASCPSRFTPGENAPAAQWTGGCRGPCREHTISFLCVHIELRQTSPHLAAIPTMLFRFLALLSKSKMINYVSRVSLNVLLISRRRDLSRNSVQKGQFVLLKKKTPWSESASELYRSSDRCLSAK